jgi:hypothetical protein
MYQKQVQRQLERVSGRSASQAASPGPSNHGPGASAGTHASYLSRSSYAGPAASVQQQQVAGSEDDDAAVSTCPAAVGSGWLHQLQQQFGGRAEAGAGQAPAPPPEPGELPALGSSRAGDTDAATGSGGSGGAALQRSGSSARHSLQHVRSLFEASAPAAEDANA